MGEKTLQVLSLTDLVHLIKLRTLLKLSCSSVGFFLQNNLLQSNQSMFPYIFIPFVFTCLFNAIITRFIH